MTKGEPSSLGSNDAPTIVLPTDPNVTSKSKLPSLDKAPLRKINELQVCIFCCCWFLLDRANQNVENVLSQEHDSLTPTASNSDFLNAGGWNAATAVVDQSDDQPPRVARISFSEPPEVGPGQVSIWNIRFLFD